MVEKYDFSGWATRNNLKCSDGRTIRKDAFKHNDGKRVPLVWNHDHSEPENILGHALLENRNEGVYAYCTFNDSKSAMHAKTLVQHGDITTLSIFANHLQQDGNDVLHGAIREVSLVLAPANPGACIDTIIRHGEECDDEAIISTGDSISLYHAEEGKPAEKAEDTGSKGEKTVQQVLDTMTEEQKTVMYAMIGTALDEAENDMEHSNEDEDKEDNSKGGDKSMKHNVFDQDDQENENNHNSLSHADEEAIFDSIKSREHYSLKQATIAHGVTNLEYLFPDARTMSNAPEFIARPTEWVQNVMANVHHTPFSRIKSIFADITEEDARAKGYIKGNLKKDEVFTLLKRTTSPTTIYKKQKIDRDDVLDIVDFDVVAWLKTEMRGMLDEEIARAILVGDGRLASSDDKIKEDCIRPVWTDDDLYTIKTVISTAPTATEDDVARAFIKAAIKSRKNYRGSGNPTLYTTEDMLTSCLLLEDTTGRTIYDVAKLTSTLRVKEIVAVPIMENLTRSVNGVTRTLGGIICNLADYNVGADKGGAVNMFDDFDIDYNAQKYLIETRCSGALVKPYSAIALELVTSAA